MTLTKTCLFVCALAFCATPALAGPLATDATTYLGIWHGSTPFQGYDPGNGNAPTGLTGYVDWAVYAPGTFPAGFSGYSPPANEFVYTYQGYETGEAPLSSVGVNLSNPAGNIGSFSGGGVSGDFPIAEFLLAFDSANWLFDGVAQGGSTSGLAFSSPYVPMFSTGSVIDDGSAALVIPVPSPDSELIPEPATMTLAVCGLAVFALRGLRRRSRKASL